MHRVQKITRQQALTSQRRTTNSDRVKLILTYHPHSSLVKNVLFRHLSLLRSDPETRSVFPNYPLVAYRRDRSLKDMLVHSRQRPISRLILALSSVAVGVATRVLM